MPTGPGWVRLGHYAVQRRVKLGYPTQRALAARTRLTERVIGKVETGHTVSGSTLAAIELALNWAPGSAQAIINGGEPTEVTAQPQPVRYADPALQAIWEDSRMPLDERAAMINLALQMRTARQGDGEKPA